MSSRDPWLDNAKMALVALVVVGHGWALLPHDALPDQLYDFLYLWHMPAFVLVTGYLCRSFTWSPQRLWGIVTTLLVPYVIIETLLAVFREQVTGVQLDVTYLTPHWPLWYLLALAIWRLATPVLRSLPAVVAIGVAVAASLVSGLWDVTVLDLHRVLGFLPFFVVGLHATSERLERLRSAPARSLAVLSLAVAFVAARFLDSWVGTAWLLHNSSYAELGVSGTSALVTNLVVLAVGLVTALSFLALVPRVDGWFTRLGSATLVVYLFHTFAIRYADHRGFGEWAEGRSTLAALLVLVLGVGLALLLAWRPVSSRLQHVIDPFGWAIRPAQQAVDLHMDHLASRVPEPAAR